MSWGLLHGLVSTGLLEVCQQDTPAHFRSGVRSNVLSDIHVISTPGRAMIHWTFCTQLNSWTRPDSLDSDLLSSRLHGRKSRSDSFAFRLEDFLVQSKKARSFLCLWFVFLSYFFIEKINRIIISFYC